MKKLMNDPDRIVDEMVEGYAAAYPQYIRVLPESRRALVRPQLAPGKVGDWVEGRAELVRATRSLLFTNIYLTVGEQKILRASSICKIPSGDGLSFGKARLVREETPS